MMFVTFIVLAGALGTGVAGTTARRRWQNVAAVGAAAAVLVAEGLTFTAHGSGWGAPIADFVWWFDAVMLTEGLVAATLACGLGLPGCEIGIWPWLISRVRGETPLPETGLACIVGLHLLDSWEGRRRSQT